MDLLTEGIHDKGIFKAVFMAGGPGSGKTYINSQLFGIPDKGLYYATGWQSPITLWWIDPLKQKNLNNARSNNTQLPQEKQTIDYWDRKN